MDLYELVIRLAQILNWPIVVVLAVFILRKPLSEMINGITDFNIGGKHGVSARVQKVINTSNRNKGKKNEGDAESINERYLSKDKIGKVSFDYSNNNGVYTVGEGEFRFDTMWSKASNESIHFYNDKSTIKTVRLAKDVDDLEVTDPNRYDSSSRARTARIGDIAIFENVHGNFLLAKIIGIKDDSRGDENDELTFEYITLEKLQ